MICLSVVNYQIPIGEEKNEAKRNQLPFSLIEYESCLKVLNEFAEDPNLIQKSEYSELKKLGGRFQQLFGNIISKYQNLCSTKHEKCAQESSLINKGAVKNLKRTLD